MLGMSFEIIIRTAAMLQIKWLPESLVSFAGKYPRFLSFKMVWQQVIDQLAARAGEDRPRLVLLMVARECAGKIKLLGMLDCEPVT